MRNTSNKGKKLIQLYVSEEKWNELRLVADSIEEPITGWCRRAIYGALRNWRVPAPKAENFDKCSVCGKKHDEKEHYGSGE